MKQAWRKLHQNERGAMLPLLLFVMLFFVWGAVMILNTGQDVREKIESQNAIDAISVAAADMAARDLNVMAMNHVASAQSFTIAVSSMALSQTYLDVGIKTVSGILDSASDKCWPNKTKYLAWICGIIGVIWGYHAFENGLSFYNYRPDRGVRVGNRITRALDKMNQHIVKTHPSRVSALSEIIAKANGIDAIFVFPKCDESNGSNCNTSQNFPAHSLPVEPTNGSIFSSLGLAATAEMCAGIYYGSSGFARQDYKQHGFPDGAGPLNAGGSSSDKKLRDHINKQSGFSRRLPRISNYIDSTKYFVDYSRLTKFKKDQRSNNNLFLDTFDNTWTISCVDIRSLSTLMSNIGGNPAGGLMSLLGQLLLDRPKNYWLKGRPESAGATALTAPYGAKAGAAGVGINAAASNFDDFNLLYVSARNKGPRSAPVAFGFDDDPVYAYSQVMVFNESSHEIYTGRWNANMVPASHMDDGHNLARSLSGRNVPSYFQKFRRLLTGGASNNDLQTVNTH